ncbi:hypothetical protein K461DRAFT_285302 [Myriangium duriaei CBS 260.36]|uniref:Uncharacterized protein n=1 Tax=Myriangium duriaei CBS 260.36 TaxID=1168546 RepID=A0A9P4JA97_9PEZI|nr:hypothetical protein K461DRAFT_285302 [Myriangium duriaei CBS 260.36]
MTASPSSQLQSDLHSAAAAALQDRRPILHHLNADTSWLLQIPRPDDDVKHSGRFYFNILIDPWLAGGQSDVANWFSQQFHATDSKVATVEAAEALLRNIEQLAAEAHPRRGRRRTNSVNKNAEVSLIDAVAISHEFSDHCHKETLMTVPPSVPVFATANAAKLIQSWSHFSSVQTTPAFGSAVTDWTTTPLSPLPSWLSIARITTPGNMLYYHSALLITYSPPQSDVAEAVIYTPHGIAPADLACIASASPPIQTLAFLHGLHDVHLPKAQLNLGAQNGLKAQRILKARYWIGTHDEVKRGGGVVSWFLGRRAWTVQEALEKEVGGGGMEGTNWCELGNGESRVLV